MKNIRRFFLTLGLIFHLNPLTHAQPAQVAQRIGSPAWSFISHSTCAVDTFLAQHPTADGRGVLIVIIDTGIDMGAVGLQKTSLGTPKVIDVQNFSGFGNIVLSPAVAETKGSEPVYRDSLKRISVKGVETLPKRATDNQYRIGVFEESALKNATVNDLDGDGDSKTRFAILAFQSDSGFVAAIDTDGDGDLSDERLMHTYSERRETFSFRQKSERKLPLMTCALNLFPNRNLAVLHFDDDNHGTHCAGIAAGFGINADAQAGQQGYNGIAPGAELISCKISDPSINSNNSASGAMKAAFDYAAELSVKQSKPVVVNMSFGVPSLVAGDSDLERYIDALIETHPNLYVCISNSNDGPGLCTTGLPATGKRVISVGALLPQDIAHDSFSSVQTRNLMWSFSSRGGSSHKPDISAPGSAHSTMPNHASNQLASGTSMASPYAAGCVALLLSKLRQEDSLFVYPQRIVKAALRMSASPLAGYTEIDCGTGVVNVPRAYGLLQQYRQSGFASRLVDYTVQAASQVDPDGIRSSVSFWRTPDFPSGDTQQLFRIRRDYPKSISPEARANFFRVYNLTATEKWLKPVQRTAFIKGNTGAAVSAVYDKKQLEKPGLYVGKIIATASNASGGSQNRTGRGSTGNEPEFELLSVIAVPHVFTPDKNFAVSIDDEKLQAGDLKRYFFAVPKGATAMTAVLSCKREGDAAVSGTIFNDKGEPVGYLPPLTPYDKLSRDAVVSELEAGVYELVVQTEASRTVKRSVYSVSVKLDQISLTPKPLAPNLMKVSVVNSNSKETEGVVRARLTGYERTRVDTLSTGSRYRLPVRFEKGDRSLTLRVSISKADYSHNTDISMRVLDADGKQLASQNLSAQTKQVRLSNPYADTATVFFTIDYAYAVPEPQPPVQFVIEEIHTTTAVSLEAVPNTLTLVAFAPQELEIQLPELPAPRAGFKVRGDIRFEETRTGELKSYAPFVLD